MVRTISNYLNEKLFEWFACVTMTGIGATVILWPATLQQTAFRYLVTIFITPTMVGVIFFVVGSARIVALIVNGVSWNYGPRVRAWCALLSAIIWMQLWIGAVRFAYFDLGVPTIGVTTWLWFFLAEIIIAYRAATDVRHP